MKKYDEETSIRHCVTRIFYYNLNYKGFADFGQTSQNFTTFDNILTIRNIHSNHAENFCH
jgi:hypothetical protein